MFRPDKITHVELVVPKQDVEKLTNEFFERGFCEIKEAEAKLPEFEKESKELNDLQMKLDSVVGVLDDHKPVVQPESLIKSVFSPSEPKKLKVIPEEEAKFIEHVNNRLEEIEPQVTEKDERIVEIDETIQKNKFFITNLRLMPDVKTKLFQPSENINIWLGLVNTEQFKKIKLDELHTLQRINKSQSLLSIFVKRKKSQEVSKLLHEVGFERIEVPFEDKTPQELIQDLKQENTDLKFEKRQISLSLRQLYVKHEQELTILGEEVESHKLKADVYEKFKTGKSFTVLEAWVPTKNMNEFKVVVDQNASKHLMRTQERDDAPTLYKNPRLVKPFQMITNLYGAPKYGRFDPTPILAITFSLFFGFMLTDFVYGLVMVLLAIFAYRGLGKYDESVKEISVVLIAFGISTMVFGMIYGSYFGDFFQKLGFQVPLLIDSLMDVMISLSIALAVGALHMGIGLYCGFFENIKMGNIKEGLSGQGVWLVFLIGVAMLLLRGYFIYIGLALIGVAVLMQIVLKFMEGGTITSVLSIFDFSGFLGDLFSYARLMALGIGTAGISLAVNFMVLLVAGSVPYIGIVFGIIIFIMGHIFNMAMNGLGAFIHSTRLHFLEFFSKFYEGGGRIYEPFAPKRKHTAVQLYEDEEE